MTRYDKKTPNELCVSIGGLLDISETEHELYVAVVRHADGIWTQIGDDGENSTSPCINLQVTETEVQTRPAPEESRFQKTWRLKDYDLTSRNGFAQLMADINALLVKYYSQWVEQPRFVKKGSPLFTKT